MRAALVFAGTLTCHLIVDQIDAGQVAIELPDLTVVVVPIALLPEDAREGDQIRMRIKRRRRSRRPRPLFPAQSAPPNPTGDPPGRSDP